MEVLYHIRPYFVGIFPFIALAWALYVMGTSNLGSWNGHWLYVYNYLENYSCIHWLQEHRMHPVPNWCVKGKNESSQKHTIWVCTQQKMIWMIWHGLRLVSPLHKCWIISIDFGLRRFIATSEHCMRFVRSFLCSEKSRWTRSVQRATSKNCNAHRKKLKHGSSGSQDSTDLNLIGPRRTMAA